MFGVKVWGLSVGLGLLSSGLRAYFLHSISSSSASSSWGQGSPYCRPETPAVSGVHVPLSFALPKGACIPKWACCRIEVPVQSLMRTPHNPLKLVGASHNMYL